MVLRRLRKSSTYTSLISHVVLLHFVAAGCPDFYHAEFFKHWLVAQLFKGTLNSTGSGTLVVVSRARGATIILAQWDGGNGAPGTLRSLGFEVNLAGAETVGFGRQGRSLFFYM